MKSAESRLPLKVRHQFPVAEQCAWLVGGVVNPVAAPVADRVQEELSAWFTWGAPHVLDADGEAARRHSLISTLAAAIGCARQDVALVRGVGEGYQNLLRGIEWRRGDRILLSDDEEAALLLPTLHLAHAKGVEVDVVFPRDNGVYFAADFADRIGPRTRLVAFSEVTTEHGSRLPARDIITAARESGCLSYVDMAHSAGLGVSDLSTLGCDAAGLLSYKWHYGPYGLGLFYLSEDARAEIPVRYAGGRSHEQLTHPSGPYTVRPGTAAYQFGPWLWATVAGWAWAVEQLTDLGFVEIAKHTAMMTTTLKHELNDINGVSVSTPLEPECSAALVSLSLKGYTSTELRDALWTRCGVRVKARENSVGIRVGVCHFTDTSDLDRLIDGLRRLARQSDRRGTARPRSATSPHRRAANQPVESPVRE